MSLPTLRQSFHTVLQQPEAEIDLARAALYFAQEEYPDLDSEEYLNALDTMAEEVRERLSKERYPLQVLKAINHYLYDDLGFQGNTADYYDPGNSYLNLVIDRRTGIPITLALVYLEIARRIDFPMVGVSMPGHFLIRPDRDDMEVHVDAFHRGELLFREDCEERLQAIYGPVALQSAFFEPVSARRFLTRMLTNLKFAHLRLEQWEKAIVAIEYILLIYPLTPAEWRDRGILCHRLGRLSEARTDLERYLESSPNAEDALRLREFLDRMP